MNKLQDSNFSNVDFDQDYEYQNTINNKILQISIVKTEELWY